MAIGLAQVKTRKIEKTERRAIVDGSAIAQTQNMQGPQRSNKNAAEFEDSFSTWMDWSAGRATAGPASVAMTTIRRLCALEDRLLGWAETQIATRLHAQNGAQKDAQK